MIYTPSKHRIDSLGSPEELEAWVEGLRGGKYKQHTGSMCNVNDTSSACCLQVAAIVVDHRAWDDSVIDGDPAYTPADLEQAAPFARRAEELDAVVITETGWEFDFLEMNDELGLSFDQIADIIEGKEVEVHEAGNHPYA